MRRRTSPADIWFVSVPSSLVMSRALRGSALTEPKQWLTPKSDSFESFVFIVVRLLVVLALVAATVYLAIIGSLTAASGTGLLAAAAALLPRG
jgi:hypothetical protein